MSAEQAEHLGGAARTEIYETAWQLPHADAAIALHLQKGQQIWSVVRLHFMDDEPVMVDVSQFPRRVAERERWLHAMVRDELGIVSPELARPPWLQGALVAGSFMLGSFVPIVPFLLSLPIPEVLAYALTVFTALALGGIKAQYTTKGALYNGLEFLGITTVGAIAGVAVGALLQAVAGTG